jgi:hypothetical protein
MDRPRARVECVDEEMAAILRAKTPAERLAVAFEMWRSARAMLVSVLRSEHPDWLDEQIEAEVARRLNVSGA